MDTATGMIKKFNSRYHTFLTKRFDRTKQNERIHFASAMTLLGHKDGDDAASGASYLEMVEFITRHGANVQNDLEQLWRRIVFNILVKNTDDHLRNHGFLLTTTGWTLSPAYDINPVAYGTGLSLNISETDNALSLDLAMEVAQYFRLSEKQATKISNKVKQEVNNWCVIAKKYGLSKAEQDRMSNAFE